MKLHRQQNNSLGFTLVELMITIAIIGILASALIPGYMGYIQRWRDTARIADITDLSKAINLYFSEFDDFPRSDAWGCVDDNAIISYLENIPRHDPLPTNWNGCNTLWRYGYAMSTGILSNPDVYSLLAITEQAFWGNYGWDLDGFTGTLTQSAYNTGLTLLSKGAWPYYVRIP
jgi:prepilin-type N-terminal cleavage/methylation domain-containing protein